MAQGGSWDGTALPTRPGLYINFIESAVAQIAGGARGTVAIPLMSYDGTAEAKKFYTVTTQADATTLFGADNVTSILLALQGGAKEVLVYTMPDSPTVQNYADMRLAFDARPFNVFVFDGIASGTEQDNTVTWIKANKAEGKHFFGVFGCVTAADDLDSTVGDSRSIRLMDDYTVNLINGVVVGDKTYNSAEYAAWVAGKIAGTEINKAITYAVAPVDDITKRLTNGQTKTSLSKGSLVLSHDGVKVKIEQGLTTSKKKIRAIRSRQAISTDITMTAADSYIGKLDNNKDGQAALIGAVMAYLERLAANNVLQNPVVVLDPQYPPTGDSVFLLVSYLETDSMERVFFTINV